LAKIFDWGTVPGNDAYKRYFGKLNQAINQETGHHFFSYFFKNLQINYFTLDVDSTILPDTETKKVLWWAITHKKGEEKAIIR
jgi:hypothetical protein